MFHVGDLSLNLPGANSAHDLMASARAEESSAEEEESPSKSSRGKKERD